MAPTLTGLPLWSFQASMRSISRASGSLAKWPRSHSRSTRRGLFPPFALYWTSPVSRCRRSNRLTVASPTPNNAAVAAYVPLLFDRYASTSRLLKSIERSAMTSL